MLADTVPLASTGGGWVRTIELQKEALALAEKLGDVEVQLVLQRQLITEYGLSEDGAQVLAYAHRIMLLLGQQPGT
jgi:hypothetical protein